MYIKRQWEVGESLEKTSSLILKISLHLFLWHLTSSGGSLMLSNHLLATVEATASSWKQDSGSVTRLTWFTVGFLPPPSTQLLRKRPTLQRLPQLQVVGVGKSWVLAALPVGSVGQPHLSASLVLVFPEGIKGGTLKPFRKPNKVDLVEYYLQ